MKKKNAYLLLNQRRQRQIIKQISKSLPHIRVTIYTQTLIVETVHLRDLSGLVVTTKNRNTFRIPQLQTYQRGNRANTEGTTINVISHKEIVGGR